MRRLLLLHFVSIISGAGAGESGPLPLPMNDLNILKLNGHHQLLVKKI
jgi:hypothetical protein